MEQTKVKNSDQNSGEKPLFDTKSAAAAQPVIPLANIEPQSASFATAEQVPKVELRNSAKKFSPLILVILLAAGFLTAAAWNNFVQPDSPAGENQPLTARAGAYTETADIFDEPPVEQQPVPQATALRSSRSEAPKTRRTERNASPVLMFVEKPEEDFIRESHRVERKRIKKEKKEMEKQFREYFRDLKKAHKKLKKKKFGDDD